MQSANKQMHATSVFFNITGVGIMGIKNSDRNILRELAKQVKEISYLPKQQESICKWKKVNMLEITKPPIRITEVPWNEMNINEELTIKCEDLYCQKIENSLRKIIYQNQYFPADNIVEPYINCPMKVSDNGFGFGAEYAVTNTGENNEFHSMEFKPQISSAEDVKKIRNTVVTYDEKATEENYNTLQSIFDGILNIKKKGASVRSAPWDILITLFGIENGFIYLYQEPEMVHEAVARYIDMQIDKLDQYEKLNVLTLNTGLDDVGSGGYGYTDEFPGEDFDPEHVKAKDMWGTSIAQPFSSVSPEMHAEFAIKHEIRWLERFNKTYYGCCDPLDKKIDILKKIKNLRKVSMSPWINIEEATEKMGGQYVFSYKPNPAIFADINWSIDLAKDELDRLFTNAKKNGCYVEVIMKNISTVLNQPRKLQEWAKMAENMVEQHYG